MNCEIMRHLRSIVVQLTELKVTRTFISPALKAELKVTRTGGFAGDAGHGPDGKPDRAGNKRSRHV